MAATPRVRKSGNGVHRTPPPLGGVLGATSSSVMPDLPDQASSLGEVNQPSPTPSEKPQDGGTELLQVKVPDSQVPAPGAASIGDPPKRGRGRPRMSPEERERARAERASTWKINPAPGAPAGMQSTRALASPDRDRQMLEMAKMVVGIPLAAAPKLGEHWRAAPEEQEFLVNSTFAYLKAKDFPDIPPGWILAGAISSYLIPRLLHPETQKQLQEFMARRKNGQA